jgi:dUTPase
LKKEKKAKESSIDLESFRDSWNLEPSSGDLINTIVEILLKENTVVQEIIKYEVQKI